MPSPATAHTGQPVSFEQAISEIVTARGEQSIRRWSMYSQRNSLDPLKGYQNEMTLPPGAPMPGVSIPLSLFQLGKRLPSGVCYEENTSWSPTVVDRTSSSIRLATPTQWWRPGSSTVTHICAAEPSVRSGTIPRAQAG